MNKNSGTGGRWSGESWSLPHADHSFAPRGKAFANREQGAHNQPVLPFNDQPHKDSGAGVLSMLGRAVKAMFSRSRA
ncbi:MAG: hypothetical protein ACTHXO_00875 [Actinomycetaceae bacterium]